MSDLTGKVAFVTGGSRGIGAGIARRLAEDGADVAVTYRQSKDEAHAVVDSIRAMGRRGLAIAADVADPQDVVGAVEQTVAELGRLDIVVNNAGIFLMGPVDAASVEDVDEIYAVHVRAAVVAVQAAVQHLADGGRIISIGSSLAERASAPGTSLYSMSKAALVGLTRGLARDLGPRGITANVVHPGPIDTDMNPADGEYAGAQRDLLAVGEFGSVEDVAATVAHLAGPEGRFITGTAIAVDGGWAA